MKLTVIIALMLLAGCAVQQPKETKLSGEGVSYTEPEVEVSDEIIPQSYAIKYRNGVKQDKDKRKKERAEKVWTFEIGE